MYRNILDVIRDFFDVVVSRFEEVLYKFYLSSLGTIVVLSLEDKFV